MVMNDFNINLTVKDIFKIVEDGIKDNKDISYFEPYYKVLSGKSAFYGSTIENEWFYRARIASDKLFEHVDELKYPPRQYTCKGRLNNTGEQIAYMSLDEIAPLVELDIGYYRLFCMAKIRHVIKDTIFYYVGVKGKYESASRETIEINTFYSSLMNSKDKICYNATIALCKHFLESKTLDNNGNCVRTGIAYNSVQEDKSNKYLYNVAVYPCIFEQCFRIEEATYYLLTYDPKQDSIIMYDINKGITQENGKIRWEKTFDEMICEYNDKFSKDIFKLKEKDIIHYKYGGGTILSENDSTILVSFRDSQQIVNKKDLICI